jgi:hypothetical protein
MFCSTKPKIYKKVFMRNSKIRSTHNYTTIDIIYYWYIDIKYILCYWNIDIIYIIILIYQYNIYNNTDISILII